MIDGLQLPFPPWGPYTFSFCHCSARILGDHLLPSILLFARVLLSTTFFGPPIWILTYSAVVVISLRPSIFLTWAMLAAPWRRTRREGVARRVRMEARDANGGAGRSGCHRFPMKAITGSVRELAAGNRTLRDVPVVLVPRNEVSGALQEDGLLPARLFARIYVDPERRHVVSDPSVAGRPPVGASAR